MSKLIGVENKIQKNMEREMNNKTNLVIADIEITTDSSGRYNLNALHRASGSGLNKAPAQWLRLKGVQELIDEIINMQKCTLPISTSVGGSHVGTFAHELLAISYAGWISPAFQLRVNQAFIDSRKPQKYQLPDFTKPSEAARAWADQVEAKEIAYQKLEEQGQKIDSLENLFTEGMTIAAFCKQLNGVNTQAVSRFLVTKNWLYSDKKGWRVGSYARDKYLTEKAGHKYINSNDEEVVTYKQELLKRGASRLHDMYMKGELPMKKDWDGSFHHSKFLFSKEVA